MVGGRSAIPLLDQLIEDALRENLRPVQAAAARVDQFLGALRTTRSQFYPQFGYSGDASRNRASENGPTPLPPGIDRNYSLYQAALGASWQIDLFGRVRRQSRGGAGAGLRERAGPARRDPLGGHERRDGLHRAARRSTASSRSRAPRRRTTPTPCELFELRFKGGVVSEVELSQVESQYQQAHAAIPCFERQVALQENLLVGAARPQSRRHPARQDDRGAARARQSPRACPRRCSSAGPTSCRPSRTCAPPTPPSAWRSRSTSRRSRSPACSACQRVARATSRQGTLEHRVLGRGRRRSDLHFRRHRRARCRPPRPASAKRSPSTSRPC